MYDCINIDGEGNIIYLGLDDKPIKRTPEEYPDCYDPYVVWKSGYRIGEGQSVYSDRLIQWDYAKYNACCQEVWGNQRQSFGCREPEDIERFLSLYFGKEITLTAILKASNTNGYSLWLFCYKDK